MFTVEYETDSSIVTSLDETDSFEDVQLIIGEDVVYIRQWNEDTDRFAVLLISYQQLLDLAASLNTTEGLHKITIQGD